MQIFESTLWKDRYLELDQHQIFVVKVTRITGDALTFNKVRKRFLLQKCSSILKGLPKWAQKIQDEEETEAVKQQENEEEKDDKEADEEIVDVDRDYDKLLHSEINILMRLKVHQNG